MKEKLKIIAGILALISGIFSGCGRYLGKEQEELLLPVEDAEMDALSGEEGAVNDLEVSFLLTEGAEGEGAQREEQATEETGQDEGQGLKECVVHICGAVTRPGVYTLEGESRVYQAIERAGGFMEDADADFLNQADFLSDGMKIYVPTKAEVEEAGGLPKWQEAGENANQAGNSGSTNEKMDTSLININTASEELLCTLPGIGSSKAKSIIAYREKNGFFQKIEDIMHVEGIKDGLFQKIKDGITV